MATASESALKECIPKGKLKKWKKTGFRRSDRGKLWKLFILNIHLKKSTIQEDPAITGRLQKKRQLITVHSGLPTTARSSVLSTVAATRCMFPRTATSMVTVSIWISLLLLHLTSTCNNNVLELGKTYRFSGYDWTACELINNGKTLVIQSHGVTSGAWPGYVMPQFGNGNFYKAMSDPLEI